MPNHEPKLSGYLTSRIDPLYLEERVAVSRRDWNKATARAEERVRLQELRSQVTSWKPWHGLRRYLETRA